MNKNIPPAVVSGYEGALSRLVIDLQAVARNYLFLSKKMTLGADCAAVVKADAYGLGAPVISKTLFAQGCRHFFVAQADEGAAVRAAIPPANMPGHDSAVYVLGGPRGAAAADFAASGLTPVLNTTEDIAYWRAAAKTAGKSLPAVIHVDSGMNRLGLGMADVKMLAADKTLLDGIDLRYVMSHLACGDMEDHPMNARQLAAFKELTGALGRPCRYSFANSGGIFQGAEYHFDLTRPGCALYGINPTEWPENPMQGVVTLQARILQVRQVETAGTVGYGAEYAVTPASKLATIAVGYADGYMRSMKSRGHVFIRGKKCPVVGRVSMDCIVADISALADTVCAGEWAEIIGPDQPVDDVARQAGTIGYEILTALGSRLKRTYEGDET